MKQHIKTLIAGGVLALVLIGMATTLIATADEIVGGNASYPWQDNFCEARSFGVGQCASGFGHQGQDIRPAPCPSQNEAEAERCDPKRQAVVAVRDSVVIRSLKQQALTLQINSRTEHIRFRYMHMNPAAMDADGILNGRSVDEGEKIGMVSNYLDHPNGTSRHLHFDTQVFTRRPRMWLASSMRRSSNQNRPKVYRAPYRQKTWKCPSR